MGVQDASTADAVAPAPKVWDAPDAGRFTRAPASGMCRCWKGRSERQELILHPDHEATTGGFISATNTRSSARSHASRGLPPPCRAPTASASNRTPGHASRSGWCRRRSSRPPPESRGYSKPHASTGGLSMSVRRLLVRSRRTSSASLGGK